VYATPSQYIRDLIRQDMQDRAIALNVLEGLDDLKHSRFSSKSIREEMLPVKAPRSGFSGPRRSKSHK